MRGVRGAGACDRSIMQPCSQVAPTRCRVLVVVKTKPSEGECLAARRAVCLLRESLRDIGETREVTVGACPVAADEQHAEHVALGASKR